MANKAWTTERLQKMLMQDRMRADADMLLMLRSDLGTLLGDYFDLDKGSVKLDIQPQPNGTYRIQIGATAVRMYKS